MQLEDCTIDEIIKELQSRPLRFGFAALEDMDDGDDDGWVAWGGMDQIEASKFLKSSGTYLDLTF
jgi:hypothetical protein